MADDNITAPPIRKISSSYVHKSYVAPAQQWKCPDPDCAVCVAKRATEKAPWKCPDPNCAICVAKKAAAAPAPAPVVTTGWKCPDPNCAICVAKRAVAKVVIPAPTVGWKCPDPHCAICVAKRAALAPTATKWVCPFPNCSICLAKKAEVSTEEQESPSPVQESPEAPAEE